MTTQRNLLYAVALRSADGVTATIYKDLIDHFHHAKNVFDASREEIRRVTKGKLALSHLHIEKDALLSTAASILKVHRDENIHIVAYGEKDYPASLKEINIPPSLLYCSSEVPFQGRPIISIVGTRRPTSYGKELTKSFIHELKKYNPIIVSGLAYGIDATAHLAALDCGIPTIAVLAGGVDRVYPSMHANTAQALAKSKGGLVSEYALGVKPSIPHFPARNRIIAGLSEATIVVEAPERSGALITAYYANEFNREVFAFPNHVHAQNAVGCHELIRKNMAHLITKAEDLAYILNWPSSSVEKDTTQEKRTAVPLTSDEKRFFAVLQKNSQARVAVNHMSTLLKCSLEYTSSLALQLELKGVVAIEANHYLLRRSH